MAQRVTTTLIDDLTEEVIQDGAGKTVQFSFDGAHYEIDLTTENAEAFHEAIADYIAAARKVTGRRTSGNTTSGASAKPGRTDPSELAKIREWAAANGYELSSRGRIAQSVRDAYDAAH